MGYYIRKLPGKQNSPRWKLQFISYRKEHLGSSSAAKPKKEWDIPRERWAVLGFRPHMTIESARERQRQLNAQLKLKREEERRFQFEQQRKDLNMKYLAAFPESFCADFEKRFVFGRSPSPAFRKSNRACWTAAQKLILHLKLEPSEWFDSAFNFYDYFFEKAWSLSYISKVLRFTNLWGYFLCRKLGLPFLPVPTPNGYERNRILDAYFRKLDGKRRRSEPITPERLAQAKRKLKAKHYQWIYLSVWAGLRPLEIDQLKDKAHYSIKKLSDGTLVLWVYQTKLVSLPPLGTMETHPASFPGAKSHS